MTEATMELREVSLGMRVSDADGHYATVRYIGPVAASKAKTDVWVGVEWDDSSRGKHDGSCLDDAGEFHRYFECAFGAGSFVKVHKLVRSVGFLDALHSKYKDTSDAKDTTENYALTAKGNQKAIEFVGEENIRKWQQLNLIRQVTLPLMRISHAGEGITPIAGHFTYVDVQRNLISSWVEVGKISSQIPSLQSLSILGNRMEPLTADIVRALPEDCFAHITTFIISKCKIHSWSAMDLLEPLLPVVEELFATHSRFEDLPMYDPASRLGGVTGFRCVKRLDVSASGISEWAQILSFGGLPALQELLADDNPLTRTGPCPEGSFAALTRLSLSAILIEQWADVDCLSTYPALLNLRLTDAPFLQAKGISESRSATIARVGNINFLNGSAITAKERATAENTYVRRCLRDFDEHAEDVVDRVRASGLHPRFADLYKHYAADLVALGKSKAANTIQSDLLDVTLQNFSFISNGSLEPMAKRLPASLQICRLRQLVKQLFGLDPALQQLSYLLLKDALPIVLDDDDMTLAQCGVTSGAVIFVNEAKST